MINKAQEFEKIGQNIKNCAKCRLCKTAHNAVPGEGNIDTELVFIGEAPGQKEDETGRPFVGRAGQLLEKALQAIGYTRDRVWIGNIIKHRPPENRDPLPDEISACQPYLSMQLALIDPKLIVTLGRFSMNYFYPEGKISRDRGEIIRVDNHFVYPIYHPAAALRNPTMMRDFIVDFKRIPSMLVKAKELKLSSTNESSSLGRPKSSTIEPVDGQLTLEL